VLSLVAGGLYLYVAGHLPQVSVGNPPKPIPEFGFSQAFRILTFSNSPFGTHARFWAVLLAISGFLLIPAIFGAAVGIVIGEIVARGNAQKTAASAEGTADAGAEMLRDVEEKKKKYAEWRGRSTRSAAPEATTPDKGHQQ